MKAVWRLSAVALVSLVFFAALPVRAGEQVTLTWTAGGAGGEWNAVAAEHDRLVRASAGGDPQPSLVALEALLEQHARYPRWFAAALWLGFGGEGMARDAQVVLALTLWMALWWMTEAVPLAVTSLLPLVVLLIPILFGILVFKKDRKLFFSLSWIYIALIPASGAPALPGLRGKLEDSFSNRAAALFRWFSAAYSKAGS